MKKTIVLFSIIAFIWSCGNNEKKPATGEDKPATGETKAAPADPTQHPDYQKGFDLVAKSDCFTCHKTSEKHVGPAYAEVAKKYAGQPEIIDTLAQRVIKGSVGHWGQVPMTPHANLSEEDARAMLKFVMTLNQ